MLKVSKLNVRVGDVKVLNDLSFSLNTGEVVALMGPNGSGKSTLSKVLAGHPEYEIESGEILFEIDGKYKDLLELEPYERARSGVFLAFQYPVEVPGVQNKEFLRASYNTLCKHHGTEEKTAEDFDSFLTTKLQQLQFSPDFLDRGLNQDFSGGEKKRNEILQMSVLSPRLCLLDETDSGLDVDALKVVSQGIQKLRNKNRTFMVITHYHRMLEQLPVDRVFVLSKGTVAHEGEQSLALEIEKNGFDSFV